jgi:hypothetical protein
LRPGTDALPWAARRIGQALRHYRSLPGFLQAEFDARPDPETFALHERLRRGEPI